MPPQDGRFDAGQRLDFGKPYIVGLYDPRQFMSQNFEYMQWILKQVDPEHQAQ